MSSYGSAPGGGVEKRPSSFCSIVEFDKHQLLVETTEPDVSAAVRLHFRDAMVPSVTNAAGRVMIFRGEGGYVFRSQGSPDEVFDVSIQDIPPLLKHRVHQSFVAVRPDLLWLHAASAEWNGKAVVLLGPSGQGKSTLCTMLCERGWKIGSDDVAPIRTETGEVLPFHQLPVRRVHPGFEVSADRLREVRRQPVHLDRSQHFFGAKPVGLLVVLEYVAHSPTLITQCGKGEAGMEIVRNATNFSQNPQTNLDAAACLAARLPVFRLSHGDAKGAVSMLHSVCLARFLQTI